MNNITKLLSIIWFSIFGFATVSILCDYFLLDHINYTILFTKLTWIFATSIHISILLLILKVEYK